MTTTIGLITAEAGFERAFGLMTLMRPHLSREDFLAAVPRLLESTGYRLVGLEHSGGMGSGSILCRSNEVRFTFR
jgi:hypothetical protein